MFSDNEQSLSDQAGVCLKAAYRVSHDAEPRFDALLERLREAAKTPATSEAGR
ncbi:hypothetical protein [Wenxinia marina]|nr:hypothetical protein [Wenxinia marina]GGL74620.1 hypothetical protein GCM10011392_31580 [Wenxinia marina]